MSRQHLYLFGRFRLNKNQRTLFYGETLVHLESMAVDVLLALLARKGNVMNKEEMALEIWRQDLVEDATIHTQIRKIRTALEAHDETRYIENHAKRGYSFLDSSRWTGMVKEEWQETGTPGSGSAEKQILLLPPAPDLFIGREQDLDALKGCLGITLDGRIPATAQPVVVVRGPPGVGKSSVAAALAHHPETREAFRGGVLWVSLGQEPKLQNILASWGRELGTDELLKSKTLTESTESLKKLLGEKRFLLIVDDVWETAHAEAFKKARGSECVLLFTTRVTTVATEIAPRHLYPEGIYLLPDLSEETALELLARLAPRAVTKYEQESRELVRDLQFLPLALLVAGRTLDAEEKLGVGWSVRQMLVALRTGAEIIRQTAPANMTDLENETTPTVAALLRMSTDRLDQSTRDCFAALGAFRSTPATFDLRVLTKFWKMKDPMPVVRALVGHGLLEPVRTGEFQMHALLRALARSMLK